MLGSFALTEPGAGTDVAAGTTTAVLDGNEYVLNGTKMFISNAPVAGVFIIFASTDKSKGPKGLSAFIVPASTPGIKPGEHLNKMGIRGALTSEVVLKDCRIPKENLLGGEGMGFKIAMMTLDGGRIGIAAQALGIAQAALDESVHYSKERVQFGKAPSPPFRPSSGCLPIWQPTSRPRGSLPITPHGASTRESPTARKRPWPSFSRPKRRPARRTGLSRSTAGSGFIKGHKVERLYRDAKITEIYEGDFGSHEDGYLGQRYCAKKKTGGVTNAQDHHLFLNGSWMKPDIKVDGRVAQTAARPGELQDKPL